MTSPVTGVLDAIRYNQLHGLFVLNEVNDSEGPRKICLEYV